MSPLRWKIAERIPETREASSFVLEPLQPEPIRYEAGQFLTFLIPYHGHEVRRSYSLGSVPGTDQRLFITVKRKENGEISRHILQHWQEGTVVHSIAPSGRFTIDTDTGGGREICFIAAGSGIVPVYALLKKILVTEPASQVTLLYQNHDETSIIYHRQLEVLQQRYACRFQRIDLLSHPLLHELPVRRLNNGLLEQLLSGSKASLFYTCGPPAFMRMVQFTLRVMGYPEEQLRKENFTVDPVPPPAFIIDPSPRQVVLHYGGKTYRYTAAYPNTILQAALNRKIELPYSCRGGRCAACTATCTSGEIKMSINEVLTQQDLEKGLVLTCVGYATSDVELKI